MTTGAATRPEIPAWLDSKSGMLTVLATGAAALMGMFMFSRRPRRFEPLPQHKFDWHGCGIDGCGKLIRPGELMCREHWVQVPPIMRMRLVKMHKEKAPELERVGAFVQAIKFVESAEIARVRLLRRIRYPSLADGAIWKALQRLGKAA